MTKNEVRITYRKVVNGISGISDLHENILGTTKCQKKIFMLNCFYNLLETYKTAGVNALLCS